ncbi:50S ribosomal protein L33, putative [Plasmodium ovale curtisi]|uniref:50S ribosomal protein L33, putative n=1 Tax=Plasmodium ovale curtisi TaxID=864141 RepID=A0A1A8VQL4_PLAOA|nr:50S ribosomal protein L33, putative [Plasmodium ovale curtisi]SBS81596.1 50S ribosomal protein L33, putative [Plasmodium ovale curtisi]
MLISRLSLRKHDPVVNRHVMFYQKHMKSKSKKRLTLHGINYARFTGKNKNLRPLLKRVEKSYLYGKFNKLVDSTYRSVYRRTWRRREYISAAVQAYTYRCAAIGTHMSCPLG